MNEETNFRFEHVAHLAPVAASERADRIANPGFGRVFTDHMVTIRYADGKGGMMPKSRPAALTIDPARCCIMRRRFSRGSRPIEPTMVA